MRRTSQNEKIVASLKYIAPGGRPSGVSQASPCPDCSSVDASCGDMGIKRPVVRNLRSVRNLNTLTYLVINARALQRARDINANLLTMPIRMLA